MIENRSIQLIRHDAILEIHLNRPAHLNALNQALLSELSSILTDIKNDETIRAVLITGEGKAFCAGADINELAQLTATEGLSFAEFGQKVFRQLETLGKPSLAAIQGYALGGGCELAMSATLRIAAHGAQCGQPEIKLGVIPGFGGTQRLSRLIGKGRALDICLTGKRFSAQDALSWGFTSEIVEPHLLYEKALSILKNITSFSPIAVQNIMRSIEQGYDLSLEEACQLEATYFAICCTTNDKKEGVSAFLEKREAVYSGT